MTNVTFLGVSSGPNKSTFWGGTYPFLSGKWSEWSRQVMNFGDSLLRSQSLLQQYFVRHFQTKIASLFVEGSIESSEFRAFDRDLNEGASIFRSWISVELLTGLWIPWNTPILAVSKMTPEPQKMTDVWKMRFYSGKHQQSTQLTMYYIGRFDGRSKTGVSGAQDPKISVFGQFQRFLG